jgi:hypothetical protein
MTIARALLVPTLLAFPLLAQGQHVLPAGFATLEGSRNTPVPFASTPLRYQQVLPGAELGMPSVDIRGLAVRPDGNGAATARVAVEIEVLLTTTTRDWTGMSSTFDQNYGAAPTVVFQRKWLDLSPFAAAPGPRSMDVVLWLDRPFQYAPANGNLLIEVKVFGNSNASRAFTYPMDSIWDGRETIPSPTTRVYSSTGPDDTTGTVGRGYGLVWALLTGSTATAYRFGAGCSHGTVAPAIGNTGTPGLGQAFQVVLAAAPANAGAALWFGHSRDQLRGTPLPLDLSPHGAPGCTLLVSPLLFLGTTADGGGTASLNFQVPPDGALRDVRFFAQWFVQDSAANALGWLTSPGLEGAIR